MRSKKNIVIITFTVIDASKENTPDMASTPIGGGQCQLKSTTANMFVRESVSYSDRGCYGRGACEVRPEQKVVARVILLSPLVALALTFRTVHVWSQSVTIQRRYDWLNTRCRARLPSEKKCVYIL